MNEHEYDFINGHVRESLGRIEAKVDNVAALLDNHGARISSIEKKQWFTTGSIALGVTLLVPKIKTLLGL